MCVEGSSVLFRAADVTYALNGRARGQKRWAEADPIVRTKELAAGDYKPVQRIAEPMRKTIFAETTACEDRADKEAERATASLTQRASISRKSSESCKAALRKRTGLTAAEASAISTEGMSKGWPPLSPLRMPVTEVIAEGLNLCQR
jgi:hypothetical protein